MAADLDKKLAFDLTEACCVLRGEVIDPLEAHFRSVHRKVDRTVLVPVWIWWRGLPMGPERITELEICMPICFWQVVEQ